VNRLGRILAVHSYKGGTGKTLLSINLAATLARHGKKVGLFDLDFRAPSLATLLKVDNTTCWMNDYLNGSCEIDKVLIDMSSRIQSNDRFFVGFANPATEAIRDMTAKDRKWEMRALGRILALREVLLGNGGFDYLVFDTSPGLQYSSINAIVSADLVIVATTFDRSDVEGTKRMLHELYELFEKKTDIVLNKFMQDASAKPERDLQARTKDLYQVPLLGIVPCFCDVMRAEGGVIFAQDKPEHPFTKILDEMASVIEKTA
jgi:septum site-determining protein MinD